MYIEENYIQLSSLQHYVFCPRQCGLIHIDCIWSENAFTARGRVMHEKVDSEQDEMRGGDHIVRSLNIYSRVYGLSGRADVVEFKDENGTIRPYPVEYKSGKPKLDDCDTVQLCAQAICLEEMTGTPVPEAAIFYGKTRHRLKVMLEKNLREKTIEVIGLVRRMIEKRCVPEAVYMKKCKSCSIVEYCMPEMGNKRIKKYVQELFGQHEKTW